MPHRRLYPLLALAGFLVLLAGCSEEGPGGAPTAPVPAETDPSVVPPDSTLAPADTLPAARFFVPAKSVVDTILVCTWPDGKRAACTFAFDDTRASHSSIAAPELEARGMRGTFNLVTSAVGDWRVWQGLLDRGHEIANHTRTHRYFHLLTPAEAEAEIAGGLHDLRAHLRGLGLAPSFTYPGGAVPDWAPALVAREHGSARGGQGLEDADPPDWMRLRGFGYYAPFSAAEMNAHLDRAIEAEDWYIGYFHSIANVQQGDRLTCPLHVFRAHVDYAAARSAELWVAPQGRVADYVRARQSFRYEFCGEQDGCLRILAEATPGGEGGVPLTVECRLKPGAFPLGLALEDRWLEIPAGTRSLLIELVPNRTYRFEAELLAEEADLAAL